MKERKIPCCYVQILDSEYMGQRQKNVFKTAYCSISAGGYDRCGKKGLERFWTDVMAADDKRRSSYDLFIVIIPEMN